MRCILAAPLICLALATPAGAQQRVVVPAGADIVIAPRGTEGPSLVRAPRPRIAPPGRANARPMLETSGGSEGLGLAAPALIAIPLLVAAYLAGSVPGNSSSSSTTAPARTR